MLGERLYPLIAIFEPERAGKITAFEATQFSRICPGKCSICHADAAFACHLRHLLSPHPYHTLRRKLEAGTPLPMSLRAFAVARAAEGRSARAGRDLQQRRPPLYVCYYYPLQHAFDRRASLRALMAESDIRQSQAQSRNQWIKPVAAQTRCGPGYQTCKLNKAVSIHVRARLISSPTAPPAPPAAAAKNGRGW